MIANATTLQSNQNVVDLNLNRIFENNIVSMQCIWSYIFEHDLFDLILYDLQYKAALLQINNIFINDTI